uniref:Profilin n=1 Tax=Halisarca dujardinii TaxID=2583056 RepID=A0A9E9FX24_HALDU|nr:profilin 2 [Halisarca dujardinii]
MGKREQWQAYIDDALLKTNLVTKAAIHGRDGVPWATSKDWQIKPEQVIRLVSSITGDYSRLHAEGIKVANDSYAFIKCNPGKSLFGRSRSGDAGICIFLSGKGVTFGTYEKGIQMDDCCGVIDRMASYLERHDL